MMMNNGGQLPGTRPLTITQITITGKFFLTFIKTLLNIENSHGPKKLVAVAVVVLLLVGGESGANTGSAISFGQV